MFSIENKIKDLKVLQEWCKILFYKGGWSSIKINKDTIKYWSIENCNLDRLEIQRNIIALAYYELKPKHQRDINYLSSWLNRFYNGYKIKQSLGS